ncbi:MAG: oligosaccharide flippase family protein [Desulfamplus sp.]|nr:oligosaccharide flippase family protein [Desulfamplus sp.]
MKDDNKATNQIFPKKNSQTKIPLTNTQKTVQSSKKININPLILSSILLTFFRLAGITIQATIILYLARTLPIDDMGCFGLVYAFLGIVRYIGPIGTDQVAMRRISREDNSVTAVQSQNISNSSILITIFMSATTAIIVMLTLTSSNFAAFGALEISAICTAIPAYALMGSFIGQIRGFGYNLSAQLPEAVGTHFFFGIQIFFLAWFGIVDRETVLICLCSSGWAVVIIYTILRICIGVDISYFPKKEEIIQIIKIGFGVFQGLSFTVLSVRAPLFLSTAIIGPSATALMEIAIRFGSMPTIFTNSVGATFSPRFALLAYIGDKAGSMKALQLAAISAFLPAFSWLMVVALAAPYTIKHILPTIYADAYIPMVLTCTAVVINAAFGMASNFLLMTGGEKMVKIFSIFQLIVICLTSILLAPRLGPIGIAWGMVLGALVRDGGMMIYVLIKKE